MYKHLIPEKYLYMNARNYQRVSRPSKSIVRSYYYSAQGGKSDTYKGRPAHRIDIFRSLTEMVTGVSLLYYHEDNTFQLRVHRPFYRYGKQVYKMVVGDTFQATFIHNTLYPETPCPRSNASYQKVIPNQYEWDKDITIEYSVDDMDDYTFESHGYPIPAYNNYFSVRWEIDDFSSGRSLEAARIEITNKLDNLRANNQLADAEHTALIEFFQEMAAYDDDFGLYHLLNERQPKDSLLETSPLTREEIALINCIEWQDKTTMLRILREGVDPNFYYHARNHPAWDTAWKTPLRTELDTYQTRIVCERDITNYASVNAKSAAARLLIRYGANPFDGNHFTPHYYETVRFEHERAWRTYPKYSDANSSNLTDVEQEIKQFKLRNANEAMWKYRPTAILMLASRHARPHLLTSGPVVLTSPYIQMTEGAFLEKLKKKAHKTVSMISSRYNYSTVNDKLVFTFYDGNKIVLESQLAKKLSKEDIEAIFQQFKSMFKLKTNAPLPQYFDDEIFHDPHGTLLIDTIKNSQNKLLATIVTEVLYLNIRNKPTMVVFNKITMAHPALHAYGIVLFLAAMRGWLLTFSLPNYYQVFTYAEIASPHGGNALWAIPGFPGLSKYAQLLPDITRAIHGKPKVLYKDTDCGPVAYYPDDPLILNQYTSSPKTVAETELAKRPLSLSSLDITQAFFGELAQENNTLSSIAFHSRDGAKAFFDSLRRLMSYSDIDLLMKYYHSHTIVRLVGKSGSGPVRKPLFLSINPDEKEDKQPPRHQARRNRR